MNLAGIVYAMLSQRDRAMEQSLILRWHLNGRPVYKMPLFKQVTPFALTVAIAQEANRARSPGAGPHS